MRSLVVLVLIALLAASAAATPLIGRSATVNKPFQAFGWVNFGYNKWAKYYDWGAGKYVGLGEPRTNLTADVMVAVGLPGRLDLDLVAPLATKEQGTYKSSGLGDVMVQLRYGLVQSGLLPFKAALVAAANLPTANKDAVPTLGDRTTDIGLALSTNTKSFAGFVAHARLGYWFNGKTNDTTKLGNMLEYMVVADYSVTPQLCPELALSGLAQGQTEVGGTATADSEVSLHTLNVLLMWKPLKNLVVRPKVAFPLEAVSRGSYIPAFYGGLDVWVTLP